MGPVKNGVGITALIPPHEDMTGNTLNGEKLKDRNDIPELVNYPTLETSTLGNSCHVRQWTLSNPSILMHWVSCNFSQWNAM